MCVMLNATVAMNLVLFNNLGPSRVADPDEVDLDPDPTSKKTRTLNLVSRKAGSRSDFRNKTRVQPNNIHSYPFICLMKNI